MKAGKTLTVRRQSNRATLFTIFDLQAAGALGLIWDSLRWGVMRAVVTPLITNR